MRILILTFYYAPDLSAGSFRTKALVDALRRIGEPDLHIDVLTTQPNRYRGSVRPAPEREENDGLTIRRIRLPEHRSGMIDQARSFGHFARAARRMTTGETWDLVFATSSRLMTAALGSHLAGRAGVPLYLDIRDLFTDTLSDVLAQRPQYRTLLPALRALERRTFRRAARINLVSAGFVDDVEEIVGHRDLGLFTNGIDDEFLAADVAKVGPDDDRPLIVYAGNIGEGQGLEKIVPDMVRALGGRYRVRIIGDGGRRDQLAAAIDPLSRDDVVLLPPVSRSELIGHYRDADILFLHLNDYPAFRKVLPSKIFEYAATGKPVVAAVAGYPALFIAEHVPGALVIPPGSVAGLGESLDRLYHDVRIVDRSEFREQFSRSSIMDRFARDIVATAWAGGVR